MAPKYTVQQIGELVRQSRKRLQVTQKQLALTSGTGIRFIVDLERGKPTCQLAKVLTVMHAMGIRLELIPPDANNSTFISGFSVFQPLRKG